MTGLHQSLRVTFYDSNPKSILTPHINGDQDFDYDEESGYASNDVEEENEEPIKTEASDLALFLFGQLE